jgi:hypothetical protein
MAVLVTRPTAASKRFAAMDSRDTLLMGLVMQDTQLRLATAEINTSN